MRRNKIRLQRQLYRAVAAGCALAVALGASGVGAWYIWGGRVLTVQSASMTPTFVVGDGVLMNPVTANDIQVGDVVAFHSNFDPAVIISHRVIRLLPHRGQVVTRGDKLTSPDPAISVNQIIGRVWAVAPGFGRIVALIRRPIGMAVTIYAPALLIIGVEVYKLSAKRKLTYRLHAVS